MPNKMDIFAKLTYAELELSDSLTHIIQEEIGISKGFISFSRYMELALYHKDYGYYNNLLNKFGNSGDFITSPTISSLFGFSISQQVLELFNNKMPAQILEFGSGNGQLMLDILKYIGDKIDTYYILELSASLQELQKQRLLEFYPQYINKVVWLANLPNGFSGIILANEILDAQPCEMVSINQGTLFRRGVGLDSSNKFIYIEQEPNLDLVNEFANSDIMQNLNNHISEINLNNRYFMNTLCDMLNIGAILLIDYGYSEYEYYNKERNKGSIRGFFRHQQLDDVLEYPGLIDITASVDFSAIAKVAIENKVDFIGYTTQANFLLNCGILLELDKEKDLLNGSDYLKLTNQINRLTSPNEMGEIFKVIGFSKGLDLDSWIGFSSGDKSHTL